MRSTAGSRQRERKKTPATATGNLSQESVQRLRNKFGGEPIDEEKERKKMIGTCINCSEDVFGAFYGSHEGRGGVCNKDCEEAYNKTLKKKAVEAEEAFFAKIAEKERVAEQDAKSRRGRTTPKNQPSSISAES